MRAVLLFNPQASRSHAKVREAVASLLASGLKLEVHGTRQRGHATHLAADAVQEGIDVIFAFGGDGTANEAIQAIAGTDVRLGVIPGGATNVLVRNLGLPTDPVEVSAALLERLHAGTTRTIGLGRANTRYFAVNAGFGFDAAVVRLVERRQRLKQATPQLSFVWCGLEEFFLGYDRPSLPISIELPEQSSRADYALCIIGNTTPYTYLGSRPLQVTPAASFDRGLDLLAVSSLRTATFLRILLQVLTSGAHVASDATSYWSDLSSFTLRTDSPLPLQVDGEYAGECEEVTFTSVPHALTLIA
ncbi:MAG: diacylglycerol kinase family protein [Nitriliruptorales bacterium]